MKNKNMLTHTQPLNLKHFVLSALLIACFTQVAVYAIQQSDVPVTKAIKKTGWDVPWISQNVLFSIELKKTDIGKTEIVEKHLISSTELLMNIETYIVKEGNNLVVRTDVCSVKSLRAYETNGHRFCYEVLLNPVNISADGTKEYYGSVYLVYYYDDDRDGVFETLELDSTKPRLPKYLEAQKNKQDATKR